MRPIEVAESCRVKPLGKRQVSPFVQISLKTCTFHYCANVMSPARFKPLGKWQVFDPMFTLSFELHIMCLPLPCCIKQPYQWVWRSFVPTHPPCTKLA